MVHVPCISLIAVILLFERNVSVDASTTLFTTNGCTSCPICNSEEVQQEAVEVTFYCLDTVRLQNGEYRRVFIHTHTESSFLL